MYGRGMEGVCVGLLMPALRSLTVFGFAGPPGPQVDLMGLSLTSLRYMISDSFAPSVFSDANWEALVSMPLLKHLSCDLAVGQLQWLGRLASSLEKLLGLRLVDPVWQPRADLGLVLAAVDGMPCLRELQVDAPNAYVRHSSLSRFVRSRGLPCLHTLHIRNPQLALHGVSLLAARSGLKRLVVIDLLLVEGQSQAFVQFVADHDSRGLSIERGDGRTPGIFTDDPELF